MVKIQNSKFGIVFFMKRCDETYMHLHMKWWFLIFSFHSLTTLCGSATTIAKPQRANNVKIVNFMTFYVMKLITALSLTFDWTVGETCIAFLKLFLRASANQETYILTLCVFQNHPPYSPNRVGVSCLALSIIFIPFFIQEGFVIKGGL